MIGTHDSYTYLDSTSSVMNRISRFWRTQDISILDQYNYGVRFFDIRVKREKNVNGRTVWRTCHGYASFSKVFTTLKSICVYFSNTLKGSKFRIWLEKGDDEDWEAFKFEVLPLIDEYEGFVQAYRKSNYEKLFEKPTMPVIKYYACQMEQFSNFSKGLYTDPIKSWAKKNNPEITEEMKKDENVCYFMDYIEIGQ